MRVKERVHEFIASDESYFQSQGSDGSRREKSFYNLGVKLTDVSHRLRKESKKGTTLVETMVTLLLISILMAMAAASLASASRIFVKVQKTQYAQSILDTVMSELRGITDDASGYIKIYPTDGFTSGAVGVTEGSTLEFQTSDGYVEVLSAEGCEETAIYIGDTQNGTEDAVSAGRLLTRYYTPNGSTGRFVCERSGNQTARAVAKVYGEGFYMKNHLEVTYKAEPDGEGQVSSILATVNLYQVNADGTEVDDPIATDSEVLELRNPLTLKVGEGSVTADSE